MNYPTNKFQRRINKLRASYRRRMVFVFLIALVLGICLGWFAHSKSSGMDSRTSTSTTPVPTEFTPAYTLDWEDPVESLAPTAEPTEEPTENPFEAFSDTEESSEPTVEPTEEPTVEPTEEPTEEPTVEPTEEPTVEPTEEPTVEPTEEPTVEPTEEPIAEPTEEPIAEPTEEPTEEPTVEPTEEPTVEPGSPDMPIAVGETYEFTLEVLADGTARSSAAETEYFSVPVSFTLVKHLNNEYYTATHSGAYMLKGNEAGCELYITLGDCDGINELVMQNVIEVVLRNSAGDIHPGYQFTNAEIAGETDSLIHTGAGATIYKRYSYGELADLEYLTLSYYENGEQKTVYFSLENPEPEATPEPVITTAEPTAESTSAPTAQTGGESYTVGDSGDGVVLLQRKLIQLGYLSGYPDGKFGSWTAKAVEQAQKDFGLTVTGIADAEFLDILYSK